MELLVGFMVGMGQNLKYPCSSPQNSWGFMDVHPTNNVSIGIDPYPYWCSQFSCSNGLE